MSRLLPVWSHFWAKGKIYRRFWQNGSTATAPGSTVTATASLLSGVARGGASVSGKTLTVGVEFFDGHAGISVTAPLNLRLNARYRHFWSRRQTWRHFWAQYEGSGITGSLVNGQLVVASSTLIVNGTVIADANLDGVAMTIGVSLLDGVNTITHGGQTLQADASLLDGVVYGDANAEGAGLLVAVSLLSGATAVFTPGQTLPVAVSLVEGVAYGESNAVGAVLPVDVSLLSGAGTGSANVVGELLPVDVSLIDGIIYVPPDALAIGKPLPVVQVSLLPGNTVGDVAVGDETMLVNALLIEGAVSVTTPGQVLVSTVSIVAGVATGETSVRIDRKFSGSVRTEKARPEDATAHGATISIGAGLLAGRVTVSNPVIEFVSVGRAEPVYHAPPVLRVLPDELVLDATAYGALLERRVTLLSGGVVGSAIAAGHVFDVETLDDPDELLMEDML